MHFESDASIRDTRGQQARDDNFPAEDLTSDHDHYVHHDYDPDVPDLTVQMTPEAYDPPFVGAEVPASLRKDVLLLIHGIPTETPLVYPVTFGSLIHDPFAFFFFFGNFDPLIDPITSLMTPAYTPF